MMNLSRNHSRLAAALAACLGLSLIAASAPVEAQPKAAPNDEARARYDRGKQLYEDGAFDAALIEFQRAYELAPSYKILFNIAQVHRQRNDYANALRAYERYLKEGGSEIDAKRKGDVEKEISSLKGKVAVLQIHTNVPGAEISVDDEVVGKTPLPQGVTVNSGKRKITASKEGRVPVSKIINVAGNDNTKIDLELLEPGGPGPTAAPPTAAPPPATTPAPPPATAPAASTSLTPSSSPTPWVAWAITGVLGAGAAVTGVLALGASSDLKSKRDKADSTRQSLDDASSRAKSMALISDLFLVGTVVAGGVSIYLTVREPSKEAALRGQRPLKLGVGPGALRLEGSF